MSYRVTSSKLTLTKNLQFLAKQKAYKCISTTGPGDEVTLASTVIPLLTLPWRHTAEVDPTSPLQGEN